MANKIKKVIKIMVLVLSIACLSCFLQIPQVIRCEILTAKYGHFFEEPELYRQHWAINDNFELKVLDYSPEKAEIYYICNDGNLGVGGKEFHSGTVVNYRKDINDEWVCISGVTRWSEMGTADGIVMPYWWHSITLG